MYKYPKKDGEEDILNNSYESSIETESNESNKDENENN